LAPVVRSPCAAPVDVNTVVGLFRLDGYPHLKSVPSVPGSHGPSGGDRGGVVMPPSSYVTRATTANGRPTVVTLANLSQTCHFQVRTIASANGRGYVHRDLA
jgi:hypothetical protein